MISLNLSPALSLACSMSNENIWHTLIPHTRRAITKWNRIRSSGGTSDDKSETHFWPVVGSCVEKFDLVMSSSSILFFASLSVSQSQFIFWRNEKRKVSASMRISLSLSIRELCCVCDLLISTRQNRKSILIFLHRLRPLCVRPTPELTNINFILTFELNATMMIFGFSFFPQIGRARS